MAREDYSMQVMLKAENWLGEKLFQTEERVKCKSPEARVYLLSFWNSNEATVAEADTIQRVIGDKAREVGKGKILVSRIWQYGLWILFQVGWKKIEGNRVQTLSASRELIM